MTSEIFRSPGKVKKDEDHFDTCQLFFPESRKIHFLTTKVGLHAVVVLSVKTLDRRKLGYLVVLSRRRQYPLILFLVGCERRSASALAKIFLSTPPPKCGLHCWLRRSAHRGCPAGVRYVRREVLVLGTWYLTNLTGNKVSVVGGMAG